MPEESQLFGRPRWHITLGVVFSAQLMTAVGFSMVFPFLPLYVEHLGSVSGMSVEMMAGLVIAVQGFTMMIVSPFWGAAADRYGRKLMVMRAQFGGAIILALMGLVQNGEQLILLRGIQGLVTGTVAANNALVAAAVPRDRIGFSMGFIQVGLWGGLTVGQLLGGFLADQFGFAMPFFITAVALFISGIAIYFGVNEEFTPKEKTDDEPTPNILQQWGHVLSANGVSILYGTRFLAGVGRFMLVPIAPLFIASLLPADAANQGLITGTVTSVAYATATISGIYLGKLGDNIGHRAILLGSGVVAMLFYLPQAFVGTVWQLWLLQGLAGLAVGGMISAPSALLARYTEPGEEGATYGLDNAITAGSRAVAPLMGAGIAAVFGLRGTFAASAVLFLLIVMVTWLYLPQDTTDKRKTLQTAPAAGD